MNRLTPTTRRFLVSLGLTVLAIPIAWELGACAHVLRVPRYYAVFALFIILGIALACLLTRRSVVGGYLVAASFTFGAAIGSVLIQAMGTALLFPLMILRDEGRFEPPPDFSWIITGGFCFLVVTGVFVHNRLTKNQSLPKSLEARAAGDERAD